MELQESGTMHTYVARAWYRDWATLFLIASFVWMLVQDKTMVEMFIPHEYHEKLAKAVLLIAMFNRWKSSTRPIGLRDGVTREVYSIPPAHQKD